MDGRKQGQKKLRKRSVFLSACGSNNMIGSEIAIIGMACRVPGADSIEEFWQNLRDGVESIAFFSEEELIAAGIAPELVSYPDYVKARGILENIDRFDASFFGYSPREAALIDPQQRLFLEESWNALEYAGYNPESYSGAIGVYAGAGMNMYLLKNLALHMDQGDPAAAYQIMIGNNRDFLATRVSYKLNLSGPGVNVQTACSSSLSAVHLACQSLLEGECDMALAGGSSISLPQLSGYMFQEGMILSPDGHCRAFDAGAHGTVSGNGVGVVLLKRLEDALNDGDCIHAVIRGSAMNNDGSLKAGYTAPSPTGQARVITEALAVAEVEPATIGYVEAHGTGTPVGDPIEIQALTQAFRAGTGRKGFCAIGSVKSNIGHLDAAAGVVGLLKTVLVLKHKQIPPSLHFERPNPEIDFSDTPFYVNAALAEWVSSETPRRAGVSSFGIGGTNVHLIMEEFIAEKQESTVEQSATGNEQLLLLSAKSESALETMSSNLAEYLRQHPGLDLADVAYTLRNGRQAFKYRKFLVCRGSDEAIRALSVKESFGSPQSQPLSFEEKGEKEEIQSLSEQCSGTGSRMHELGTRWAAGEDIAFSELHAQERRHRIPLPTYPFERQHYWIEKILDSEKPTSKISDKSKILNLKSQISDWFYLPSWERSIEDAERIGSPPNGGGWLIFLDECGLGECLAERLRRDGQIVTTVRAADAFKKVTAGEFLLRPEEIEDYDALFKDFQRADRSFPTSLIHLWSVTPLPYAPDELERSQNRGLYSLIAFVQALGKISPAEMRMAIISNGIHDVTGEEALCPQKSTVLGPVKVVPQELPAIRCKNVDIQLPENFEQLSERLVEQVLSECSLSFTETIVAYRGRYRWLQRFKPLRLPASHARARLREKGVYLITGGLGGIGLTLAEYLAKTVRAKLILTGRSAFPDREEWEAWLDTHPAEDKNSRRICKLLELERLGAEVMVFSVDVANRGQMQQLIEQAELQFGPIHGIIHAAGVAGEQAFCPLEICNSTVCEQQFRAKISGLFVLQELLQHRQVDFVALCSSLASVLGGRGLTAYAAANMFMDVFTQCRNFLDQTPWLCINWDAWSLKEGTRASSMPGAQLADLAMTASEGQETFHRILCSVTKGNPIVSTGDLQARQKQSVEGVSGKNRKKIQEAGTSSSASKPTPLASQMSSCTQTEQSLMRIWQQVLGIEQIDVQDDFFELGGDSLTIAQVISRIRKAFGLDIDLDVLFEKSSVAELAEHLDTLLWAVRGAERTQFSGAQEEGEI